MAHSGTMASTPRSRAPSNCVTAQPPHRPRLTCWSQRLLLWGALAAASPKTLRQQLWHTAARVTSHARRDPARPAPPGRPHPTI